MIKSNSHPASKRIRDRRQRGALAITAIAVIMAAHFAALFATDAHADPHSYDQRYRGPGNSASISALMQLWGEQEIIILVRRDEAPEIQPGVFWSELPRHPDAREIRVPAGASLAAAAAQIRSGYGDHLLLERGGVWHEPLPRWNASGRSAEFPILIGAYGSGPRPVIVDHFQIGRAHV